MHERSRSLHRRRRSLGVLVGFAAAALLLGLVTGARHVPPERRLASEWTHAWAAGDYRAMYGLLTPGARQRISLRRFSKAYSDAATTATLRRLDFARARVEDGDLVLPTDATTRIFGDVTGDIMLTLGEDEDGAPAVEW